MIEERYQLWSTDPYFDEKTREELLALSDRGEIEDRFYTDLEFGTGGLRGIIGAGTNRMNKYVIRKTTQGLAEYISEYGPEAKARGVVIAHDSRRYSAEFALEAALVLARNGVHVHLFDALRPTPELSFAVRFLHTVAGIVITASHNPKEYNGYKVYWEDGGQVPPEQADAILAKIEARENWLGLEPMAEEEALARGLLHYVGAEVDQVYLDKVKGLALHPDLLREHGRELSIVYTPLHGAGNVPVRRALSELGLSELFVVPEQEKPDPEFTTVPYPNPEIPSTLDLSRKYGEARQADLLLATDPDSDRLGVVAREYLGGPYRQLSGNQAGVFLTYYLLSEKKKLGLLPEKARIIKTVASTDLADAVAEGLGVGVENVLTGFKFIAEKEKEMEEGGWGVFQFGFEESYGYLAGDFVRDKDAVIAAVLFSEAALYYKINGERTIWQVLQEIYARFGHYKEGQESFPLPGKEGREEMARIMQTLREEEILTIGGLSVERRDDYELRQGRDLKSGRTYPLVLPKSNVLRFSFAGGGFVMARPSGTEPKIKFYFSVKNEDPKVLDASFERVRSEWLKRVRAILARLQGAQG
ncbi:phosphoglucosamine mutase [Acididesulfobacillus acetoxydans]|uniref:Phosphoglucomutase n=1 Tax=Acididesulfobacillus acetoxydans TaxID=1561005 RepID=A0A8S0X5N7_9FIRM|nr:phospho-sugar mutase [Acididesulfobacillus acetoxydans]CAA7601820.1 phosphoglucosamine mutase [Acididesulfobacillus acetoxydans]CEJ09336.1 Phosphoglucomutase [Acididesulfobacillus acetoxydans]